MDLTDLLTLAASRRASDLHLRAGAVPAIRLHGDIVGLDADPLPADRLRNMLLGAMTEEQRAAFDEEMEVDFAVTVPAGRFRVNAFTTLHGPAAVFRQIPTVVPSLEQLGAPAVFARLAELERGLVLVTGPTGSGKSTTLAAMIDHVNRTAARHILTIEDPIEFVHKPVRSLINQREVGGSTRSFSRALKSALREDPDVILVGEMRDLETISLALTAAETGHLVLGTLHTSSAPKTVDRIIDVFPAGDKEMVRAMLSESVQAIVSQSLLKRADGGGRVAAYEILIGTGAVRNLIRENKIPQIHSMMQMGSNVGMRTMEDALADLVARGLVSESEVASLARADALTAPPPAARAPVASQIQAPPQPAPQPASAPAQRKGLFNF